MNRAGPRVASRSLRLRSQRSRSVEYSVERQCHARSRVFAMAANGGDESRQRPRPQGRPLCGPARCRRSRAKQHEIRSRNRPPRAHPRRRRPINSRRNSPPAAIAARPAQPIARRPARRHPRMRRKAPIQRQLPSQVQTQQWIQARPRMRRPTKPARHSTFLPEQPRPWSPTRRPTPLHRIRRQKPHRTTRTTAAVRPTPAPSWPRRLRPTSRHSPLRRPLSPI